MTDAAKTEPWFPAPWRVEEDWTAEIIAANGKLVMKLPYPQNLAEAHAIVEAVNAALAHSTIDPSIQCTLPWDRARDGEDDDY